MDDGVLGARAAGERGGGRRRRDDRDRVRQPSVEQPADGTEVGDLPGGRIPEWSRCGHRTTVQDEQLTVANVVVLQ